MARSSLKNVIRLIDQAKNVLPPEQCFLADLKKSIELDDIKGSRKPSQTYKPSSMSCIRNMYYQVMGQDTDPASSNYIGVGICNSGTDIHVRIQTAVANMKANGMNCEYVDVAKFVKDRELSTLKIISQKGMETKLYHEQFNMSFMCDGIIKYDSHYYILEIKSETANKWYNREGVDPSHYNQGIAYSVAFGLDEIIFIYINRDMLDMKAFLFTVTDDMKHELISKIVECDSYVSKKIAPPKPTDINKKTCEWCAYRSSCRKDN